MNLNYSISININKPKCRLQTWTHIDTIDITAMHSRLCGQPLSGKQVIFVVCNTNWACATNFLAKNQFILFKLRYIVIGLYWRCRWCCRRICRCCLKDINIFVNQAPLNMSDWHGKLLYRESRKNPWKLVYVRIRI